jgi:hypothetical protein
MLDYGSFAADHILGLGLAYFAGVFFPRVRQVPDFVPAPDVLHLVRTEVDDVGDASFFNEVEVLRLEAVYLSCELAADVEPFF